MAQADEDQKIKIKKRSLPRGTSEYQVKTLFYSLISKYAFCLSFFLFFWFTKYPV